MTSRILPALLFFATTSSLDAQRLDSASNPLALRIETPVSSAIDTHLRVAASSRTPSPSRAFALSALATVTPIVVGSAIALRDQVCDDFGCKDRSAQHWIGGSLVVAGVFAGPATGYYYGRQSARGTKGILMRSAVFAGSLLLTVAVDQASRSNYPETPIPYLGAAFVIGSGLWDIATVHRAVSRRNER